MRKDITLDTIITPPRTLELTGGRGTTLKEAYASLRRQGMADLLGDRSDEYVSGRAGDAIRAWEGGHPLSHGEVVALYGAVLAEQIDREYYAALDEAFAVDDAGDHDEYIRLADAATKRRASRMANLNGQTKRKWN
jgi:hypothetical protein